MAGFLEEWFAMGRARNLREFEAAIEHLQIPTFSVVYADKDGHIMLVFNGDVPIRPKGDAAFWAAPVPGIILRSFGNEFTRMVIFPRYWTRPQVGSRTRIARRGIGRCHF